MLDRPDAWPTSFCRAACAMVVGLLPLTVAAQPVLTAVTPAKTEITRHAAKLVCGIQPDPKNLQLVRGAYATAVNLLNTGDSRAEISATLALAYPPVPPEPGDVFTLPEIALEAGEAAAIDCEDLRATVFPFGFPGTYIDGFVVIDSSGPISISAVYTAAPLIDKSCCKSVPGPIASIDVETVGPVEMAASSMAAADLVPEQPVRESDPLGAPGTAFCSESSGGNPPDVVADIVNIGAQDAAATTATVDFGPYGTASAAVGPLAAGASQAITVQIPTACFGTGVGGACEFDVIADAPDQIAESLETNNVRHGQCLRAPPE